MKLFKSHIHERPIEIDEDEVYSPEDFASTYPVRGIEKCHVKGSFWLEEGKIFATLSVQATLLLEDSNTAERFRKKVSPSMDFQILDDEDGEGEGFIVPGPVIDMAQLALLVIRFSLPSKVVKKGSKRPQGNGDFRLLSEEEAEKTMDEYRSSPFDALQNIEDESKKSS